MLKKRRVRGAKDLSKYLKEVGCPMSEATIFKLLKEKRIPHIRPSNRVLLFDLDSIDKWIEEMEVQAK